MRERLLVAAASGALLIAMPLTAAPARVVALGGDVTEIMFALGAGERLVGVDATSTVPAGHTRPPDVGYARALNAEGILSLQPDLVVGTHDAGPPTVIEQLRAAGVTVELLPKAQAASDVGLKVRRTAAALGLAAEGAALAARLDAEFAALAREVSGRIARPRVLFLLTSGPGAPLVAGADTAAALAIGLAGGVNAAQGFSGYKPMGAETLSLAAPEHILMMDMRLAEAGGVAGVLAIPGVADTPAGRAGRIMAIDGIALLGFGPGAAPTLRALAARLADTP